MATTWQKELEQAVAVPPIEASWEQELAVAAKVAPPMTTWQEDLKVAAPLTFGEKVKEVGKAALRMPQYVAANVGDLIYWMASQKPGGGPGPSYVPMGFTQEMQAKLTERNIKFANNVSEYWRKAAATGVEAEDPRIEAMSWLEAPVLKGLTSGIESSGSFLVAVGASIITKNPTVGLALLGAMSGSGTYRELREEDVEHGLANVTALLAGTFEAVTEKLPFNAIFGKSSKRFLAKFLKSASMESLQEFFQNMGENYLKHFATEYQETGEPSEALKISWAQLLENWQDAISGGLVMGGAGAVMTGRAGLEVEERAPVPPMSEEEQASTLMSFARGVALVGLRSDIAAAGLELSTPQNEEQVAADEIAARLGKKLVWFKDTTGEFGITGAVSPGRPGVIFMDVGADRAAASTVSHEILHHLKQDAPELYAKLAPLIFDASEGFETFKTRRSIRDLPTEVQQEEFVAEMFSQAAMQPGFWDKAFQSEPGLAERLWQIIKDALAKLAPQGQREIELDAHVTPYIADFQKIEAAAAVAAKKYAPVAKAQANVRLVRRQAVLKQQAGEKLTPTEEKAVQFSERELRDMRAEQFRGEIKFSQKESVNKRVRKIAGEAEGQYADHAWTFLSRLAYERQLPDNTIAAYLTSVREFSRYMKDSGRGIQAVRPEDLRAFKREMSKAGKSASTMNLRMAGLNEFFGFLTMTDQIAGNPMLALSDELVKGEQKLPKVLSVKQMGAFVRAAREKTRKNLLERNIAMSELLWATGARASEITDIKVSDLRLGERQIILHGKGDKDRLVPITKASAAAIQAHIDKAGLQRHEYLFQTRNKDQLTRQDIGRFVKQYAKKAGLPSWVSPHTMRHTFATQLMEGGADIRFIQEMMGHSTPEITALYAQVTIQRKKEVFKKYHPSEVGVLKRAKLAKKERAVTRKYVVTKEGKLVRQPSVRQAAQRQAARQVGMEVEAKIVTEEEALKATMKAQKKAAVMGFKAGLTQGKAKAKALQSRYKTLSEWRKAFKKFVKKSLPANVQGTMLSALEGIKGEKSYLKAVEGLIAKIEQTQRRQALAALKKQISKIQKKWGRKGTAEGYKLMPQYEKVVTRLMDAFTTKREMKEDVREGLEELLAWAQEERAILEQKGERDTPFHKFEVLAAIERLQKELGKKSVAEWPAERIDLLREALLTVVYQHLFERTAFNRVMRKRLEADIAQGIVDVGEAAGKPVSVTQDIGKTDEGIVAEYAGKAKALLGRHNYNLSTLSKIMSGMKAAGPVWRRLAGNIEQGLGKALHHKQAARDMLWDALRAKGVTAQDLMGMSNVLKRAKWKGPKWLRAYAESDFDVETRTIKRITTQSITVKLESGKDYTMSIGEALDIYMHTRNQDNYKALIGPNGISRHGKPVPEGAKLTDADVDNITDELFRASPKAKLVAEALEEVIAFQQNEINRVSRRLLGYDLATVEGYWHIKRLMESATKGKKAAYTYETIEGRSHLKERIGGKQPLVIGDVFNNMIETLNVGADYVGLAEPMRNANTMLSDKDFIKAAQKNGYGQYLKDIKHQLDAIQDPSTDRIWHDKMIAAWTRNVTRAIFAHNLRLAAQQEISVFLAFAHLSFKYATALRPAITKDVVARIVKWSPYIRDRFGGHISREVGDIAETGGAMRFWTGKDQYANWGTFLIRHFDKRAIVNVWRMVEAEVADRAEFGHLTKAEKYQNGAYQAAVAARAEQILRDTQPTWHKVDRSIIGSDPSTAARMMTMFHSQREKMVQMAGQANAVYRNSAKDAKAKRKLGRTYGLIGMNLVMVNMWKMVFGVVVMRKEDEPEEFLTNVLADIPGMFYILGPPIRESVKAASRAARGKRAYQVGAISMPPLKVLESGKAASFAWSTVAAELLKGHNVEKELLRAVDETWDFSQYAFGLPFKSVTDIAKAWSD